MSSLLFGSEWFARHQTPLLMLANCRAGRRLLRIGDDCPRNQWIVAVRPNSYTWANDPLPVYWRKRRRGEPLSVTTDFRTHPKFGKRLYYEALPKWRQWRDYLAALWSPFGIREAWADTLTAYPDPDPETASSDGRMWHTYGVGNGVAWATMIAAAGTNAQDNSTTLDIRLISDSGSNTWYFLQRSIMGFNTSALGATATISAAITSLLGNAKDDGFAVDLNIGSNLYSASPASATAVTAGDFDSIGSIAYSANILYAAWSTSAYNDYVFNADGITAVAKTGVTQLGFRDPVYDVAASAPPWEASQTAYIWAQSADTTGTTQDPKLVVTYTLASGPEMLREGLYW